MALINTIKEMRAVLPRLMSNLSDASVMPNFERAAWKHIIPVIGQSLYENLDIAYNESGAYDLTAEDKRLIKHIQLPLASFALHDEMALIHATITDNGIRTANSPTLTTAHRWEYLQLKNALIETAMDGVEILISYLYANPDAHPAWQESPVFKTQSKLLIRSSADFDRQYKIYQPARTYFQLIPTMTDVEENYIASRIGRDLFDFVREREITVTIDRAGIDVVGLLKKAIAYLTIKRACDHLHVRFSADGFTLVFRGDPDDENLSGRGNADPASVSRAGEAANREGQNYLSKAAYYLGLIGTGAVVYSERNDFLIPFTVSPLWVDPATEIILPGARNWRRRGVFVL